MDYVIDFGSMDSVKTMNYVIAFGISYEQREDYVIWYRECVNYGLLLLFCCRIFK